MALPSSLQHLQDIPQPFLDPDTSFVVMTETDASALDDARQALNAVTWLCLAAAAAKSNSHTATMEVPAQSMAALLELVGEKIGACRNIQTMSAMRRVRADLFQGKEGGV